jgi:5-carboxymethyl-2-hydroxymuconate isomerase
MPHCILEFSDNVLEKNVTRKVLIELHSVLMKTELFALDDIKSRAIEHKDYLIGDGDLSRAFVTLTVSILSGRTDETKKAISDSCLDVLNKIYADSLKQLRMSITVKIQEMDKASYGKEISY